MMGIITRPPRLVAALRVQSSLHPSSQPFAMADADTATLDATLPIEPDVSFRALHLECHWNADLTRPLPTVAF